MTREEILNYFKDINFMYNNSSMFDTLKRMLDELTEPCEDTISRKHLLSEIDDLMQSPWFNNGKDDDMFTHYGYVERKEAVEVVRDLCVKKEPPVTPKQRTGKVLEDIRAEIMAIGHWRTKGELPNGYLVQVIDIIDKYKAESEEE